MVACMGGGRFYGGGKNGGCCNKRKVVRVAFISDRFFWQARATPLDFLPGPALVTWYVELLQTGIAHAADGGTDQLPEFQVGPAARPRRRLAALLGGLEKNSRATSTFANLQQVGLNGFWARLEGEAFGKSLCRPTGVGGQQQRPSKRVRAGGHELL